MQTKFRVPIIDDAVDRGEVRGEVKGIAQSLLMILDKRFTVPAPRRAEIAECSDAGILRDWMLRALDASSLDEVLAGTPHTRGKPHTRGNGTPR